MAGKRDKFDYFEFFIHFTEFSCKAAEQLYSTFGHYSNDNLDTRVKEMHRIENDADSANHEMLSRLAHEFMTPIELEDIVALSKELDDVVDSLDDIIQHAYMFDLKRVLPEMVDFSKLILDSCRILKQAFQEFKNFKKSTTLRGMLIEINTIESQGDQLFAECVRKQYTTTNDTRVMIINVNMFDLLESCLDNIEDVADILERVIMKKT
jgi:uncharacterized protein Yka (UPF0111/DUF47 family)